MGVDELVSDSKYCSICGSKSIRKIRAEAFDVDTLTFVDIVECNACDFAWQFPLSRSGEESVGFYEKAYSERGTTQTSTDYFNPRVKREVVELEVDFVGGLPVADKFLLDIGAGSGAFAKSASESGWDVVAVDPALNESDDVFDGIKAVRGTTDDVPVDCFFDVVTMWDVIEHMFDPKAQILKAKSRLKNKGWLVIETGNYKSGSRLSVGVSHWIFQQDHRWYFSPDSMESILLECGFSNIVFSERVLRPGSCSTPLYKGPSGMDFIIKVIRNPFDAVSIVRQYCSLIKAKSWRMSGIEIFTVAAQVSK